jgi:glutathione peroxidase-family protein
MKKENLKECEETYLRYFNHLEKMEYKGSTILQIFGILNKRTKILYNTPL